MFDLMRQDAEPVSRALSGVRSGVLSPDDMAALDSLDVPDLVDARGVMDAMLDARQAVKRARVTEFRLAATFADLHGVLRPAEWTPKGAERLVQVGGDGTPEIAEFCLLELAARLHLTADAARILVGDALSVRHRLHRAWDALNTLAIDVWQARDLAALTAQLCLVDARWVDDHLASSYGSMSWKRIQGYIDGLKLQIDPTLARDERTIRLSRRTVELHESHLGVTDLYAILDAVDARFRDARLTQLAGILATGGSTEELPIRRATALGILASPARALQLLQASLLDELPDDLDVDCPARGQRGHTCGQVTVDPDQLLPVVDLVVHVTDDTLRDGHGVARSDTLGPLLLDWLRPLLGHTRINLRPVLDCNNQVPTDAYECPDRMREAVQLRNPYEVFPWSTRRSTGLDLDHTTAYTQGDSQPPGQTRPDNLGPLTRRAHRAKTHGGWQVTQPMPGIYLWRSPLGYRYLVTPSKTWALDEKAR